MKKAIYCFLAVFMLLVVSIASASSYTVKPNVNNNVYVEKQVVEEQITPVNSLFWGEATINVHAEVHVYEYPNPPFTKPVDVGYVRAVSFMFPLMNMVTGNTDSDGNCQLKMRVLRHIPSYCIVTVVADLSGWAGFNYGDKAIGRTIVYRMYAKESYTAQIDITIKLPPRIFPSNNIAEQKLVINENKI